MSTGRQSGTTCVREAPAALQAMLCCLLIVLVVAAAGCGGSTFTVNGKSIPKSGFDVEVKRRLAVIKKNNPSELKGERGVTLQAETRRQVATELVKAELVRQQAAKLGVALPADEVNRRVQEEQQKLGADQFEKRLKEQGITLEQYKKTIREEALVDELGMKVSKGVSVTPDEAESFYLINKELFSQDAMVHAAHILTDNESQADIAAADAKRGEDFAMLAKLFSKDEATRLNGGDLGWIEKGTREPAFDQAAFSLEPGQVSGVVRASDGFHVIKVFDRREASTPSFSEVAGQAIDLLTNRKKDEVFSDWLRTVYANARVDVGAVGKWDPRLGIVVRK
jgi:foldase protein PrsA